MENKEGFKSLILNLAELWNFIEKKRKIQLFFLLILINISGFFEIFSLTSVIPFINVFINPEKLLNNQFIIFFGISKKELLIIIPILFGSLALISSLIRVLNLWLNGIISAKIGSEISLNCFKNILSQDYQFHLKQSSNVVINNLSLEMSRIPGIINAILRLITATILLISLLIGLLIINWKATLFTGAIVGSIYFIILYICKEKLSKNGRIIARRNELQLKYIQEGLGSIKDIILNQNQNIYIKDYRKNDIKLRIAQIENKFLAVVPRFGIEGIFLFLISIYTFIILNFTAQSISTNFPIIGSLALGGSKIFPVFQLIYVSLASIQSQNITTKRVLEYLKLNNNNNNFDLNKKYYSSFKKNISFSSVGFRYEKDGIKVLKDISFRIDKGQKIGIIGTTGSGKSTLLDLFMGLNKPTEGKIFVDGFDINDKKNLKKLKSWYAGIAHVPQKLYFANISIAENIAFGTPREQINMSRIKKVSRLAKISDFIEKNPYGYGLIIGERGINLSGGQLQRIAIARALYRNPKILILDEITSALDIKTEQDVLSSIRSLDKSITIVVVAHRKSTLKNCDKIIRLENGRIDQIIDNKEIENF